jgi:tRNA(Ile)-lysidine synthase
VHDLEIEVLRRLRAVGRGGRVVVGVSGGPDSCALLAAAAEVAPRLGVEVVAAHFDHGLRAEARADADFVRALAAKLGIRYEEGRTTVAAEGRGIEAAARAARYAFLQEVAERVSARWVLVAHTRDDQAETVLLAIARGAGLRGLKGMARKRRIAPASEVRIVRPLLSITRARVMEYLAARGIEPRHDAMNLDRRFTRARARHDVLPAMRALNPRIDEALDRLAYSAAAASRLLERQASTALGRASVVGAPDSKGPLVLDRRRFRKVDRAVLDVALARALRARLGERLALAHVSAVARLVRRGGGPVALPAGLEARLEDGRITISKARPRERRSDRSHSNDTTSSMIGSFPT